jgi:hypothetical protein
VAGIERRRTVRRRRPLVADRPDRIALWAPMLGFFLLVVAAATS